VKAIAEYEGRAVRLTRANIDRAVGLYFAKSPTRKSTLARWRPRSVNAVPAGRSGGAKNSVKATD